MVSTRQEHVVYIVWRSYWAYALRRQSAILGMATSYLTAHAIARQFEEASVPHISAEATPR